MSYYQNKWEQVRDTCDPAAYEELAQEVALTFLDRFHFNDDFDSDYIRILCEMSTSDDEALHKVGASALFGIVVESLCDDFEELQSEAYNRLMCEILTFCRQMPNGDELDKRLRGFGMKNFGDLNRRVERLRKTSCNYRDLPEKVSKVLFLSRVTIGADVAVTSVLIQRFARLYPDAQLVVLGSGKCEALFTGNPRVSVRSINYTRRGSLLERLTSWFDVLEAIESEAGDAACLVIDPDSRLSQLGVLPMFADTNYLFLNSRGSFGNSHGVSISEMANHWLTQVTANNDFCYPAIWLDPALTMRARNMHNSLREAGAKKLVAINFGVGGNSRKRVGDDFEVELILEILKEEGTVVLLDKGFGEDEQNQALKLLGAAHALGHRTADLSFAQLAAGNIPDANMITVAAGIDEAAALISVCDEFIGYDSACQHIAAAAEVPAFTIFAGSNNTRFVRRWRPFGLGKSDIIHVDTLTHPPIYNRQAILQRLMHERNC